MKPTASQVVTYGFTAKRTGLLKTYYNQKTGAIKYKLFAGQKGTGDCVAQETCQWGCLSQHMAMERMNQKVGHLQLAEDSQE